jgi:hypothetical protein
MRHKCLLLFLSAFSFASATAQKGEKSIAAGLLLAFADGSTSYGRYYYNWGTGIGLEVAGQSNITDKGSLLLQLQVTRFRGSSTFTSLLHRPAVTPVSVKGGYRHRLTASGFFANALLGFEYGKRDLYLPIAAGIGKRIQLRGNRFIDAGIEFASGFTDRFNVKAVYSLFQSD